MTKPKKVLIVSYYWPPAGGPGVQRWLKFAKYLPDFGIAPIVYVPENPSYPIVDNDIINEVSTGVTVIKHPIREPYRFASLLSRKQTQTISSGLVPAKKKQRFVQKILLYIRGNYFVPDARVGWVKPSISFLESLIKREDISTIITTGPPHSMHLIGLGLKEKLPGLQWIADFRDPWTTIGYHDKLKMTSKTKKRHKELEKSVLENATQILVTSPRTKKEFQLITSTPIQVITNGYDLLENNTIPVNDKFVVSHIGSLLSDRNPKVLWEVLSEILRSNKAFREAFSLRLVGRVSEEVLDSILEYGLGPYTQLEGYVSHKEAVIMQSSSNLLLLIEIDTPQTQSIIPGKLFEYLASRRPILAIGPQNSDMKDVITTTKSGDYYTYNQEFEIKKAILTHFEKYSSKSEVLQTGDISRYHRRVLTKSLSNSILHSWEL